MFTYNDLAFRKIYEIGNFIKSHKQKHSSLFFVIRNLCVQMNKVKTCLTFIFFESVYIYITLRYNLESSVQKKPDGFHA